MSYLEYSDELYEAWDKVNSAVWYDDVVDEIETIMQECQKNSKIQIEEIIQNY